MSLTACSLGEENFNLDMELTIFSCWENSYIKTCQVMISGHSHKWKKKSIRVYIVCHLCIRRKMRKNK